MTQVIRWNPWERRSLVNEFDRLFDDMLTRMEQPANTPTSWGVPVDVVEREDAYVVNASVPGIDPDAIDITLTENVLTIRGETSAETESDTDNYHIRERHFGQFNRAISLPTRVDADAIEASCDNGVLTIRVPKADEVKPRRIQVNRNQRVIENGS